MKLRRVARAAWLVLETLGSARLSRDDLAARACRLRVGCERLAEIHGLRLAIDGAFGPGPCVIVANHVSYLDPIAIGSLVACAPIAKGEVASWPIIGPAARALGVGFVRRGDAASGARVLLHARAALRAGVSVLNFPEGTTTDGARLARFHRGIFGLARLVGVPVVPIALHYASADLAWTGGATFLPHYLRTAARRAPALHLTIGAAIDAGRFASADELADVTHHRIARMLRGQPEPHGTVLRLGVPPSRTDALLPPPRQRVARAG